MNLEIVPDRWQELLQVVLQDNLEKVNQLLMRDFQIGDETQVHICGSENFKENPPLHQAILTASDEVVNALIDNNFDVHGRNRYMETPLHLSCRKGREAIVRKLLAAGSDVNSCDCGGNTPLFNAVTYSHPHIAQVLVKAGCDLDSLNEELMTPLDQAILYDQREIISILLKAGCSIEKFSGHVYYEDHYINSVATSLWRNGDVDNILTMLHCGYEVKYSEVKNFMKLTVMDNEITDDQKALLQDILQLPLSLKHCSRISLRKWLIQQYCMLGKPPHTLESLIENLPLPSFLKKLVALQV